jgi:dihydropyrimidinase
VETRLSLTLSANRLQLQKFVEVTSTNAAKLYGLYPRKGALIPEESDADLTIWYPNGMEPFALTNSLLHHNVDYTPYEGRTMKQWPRYTVLRGEVVWAKDEGGLVGRKGYGQFLKRDVSSLAGSRSDVEWDVQNF